MDISPYERSVTSGVYNFVRWLGGAIAPILSGVIGHTISPQSPFLVGGIVVLVGCVMILIPIRKPVEIRDKNPFLRKGFLSYYRAIPFHIYVRTL